MDMPLSASPDAGTDVARVVMGGCSVDVLSARHFTRTYPPHFHDTYAIGVVDAGATRITTHRGQWVARAGDILAFAPGEVHAAAPLGPSGYSYRMIYPSASLLDEFGVTTTRDATRCTGFRAPVIDDGALAAQLGAAHQPLMHDVQHEHDANIDALAAALRRLMATHVATRQTADARVIDLDLAEEARTFLHRHVAEPVRVSALADQLGVTVFHLIRTFHRVVGVPPYAYLVQLRINRARALLAAGADVSDVAYACGFSDQSHLTRMFKRTLGVPPGQYVRQIGRRAHRSAAQY